MYANIYMYMDKHVIFILMKVKGNNLIFPLAEFIIALIMTMGMGEHLMEQSTNKPIIFH